MEIWLSMKKSTVKVFYFIKTAPYSKVKIYIQTVTTKNHLKVHVFVFLNRGGLPVLLLSNFIPRFKNPKTSILLKT